jgi:hypothetical protein
MCLHFQDPLEFYGYLMPKLEALKMDSAFLNRNVNEGFSGGEKKRNEVRPPHPAVLATGRAQPGSPWRSALSKLIAGSLDVQRADAADHTAACIRSIADADGAALWLKLDSLCCPADPAAGGAGGRRRHP